MSKKLLSDQIIEAKKKYYNCESINYSSDIYLLLNEIHNNIQQINSDYKIKAIEFAVNYLDKKNDLFPDYLSFGLLDDYLVLRFIVFKIIYNYDESICYSSINHFLTLREVKQLIETVPVEIKKYSEIKALLTDKLKQLNRFDTKLRIEILQIINFLQKIIETNSINVKKIAQWALTYFLQEDDAICDTTDFGYVDDFLVLKSAELAIKEKLYQKYPKHYKYLCDYEKLFLPLYFKMNDKPIHLNDFQKIISIFFFNEAFHGTKKKHFGIVFPEQSSLTKTLIYFFYQLGLLAKSYFVHNSKEDILNRLQNGERILCNKKDTKIQYFFSHEENEYLVFHEKVNKQGRKSNKDPVTLCVLKKNLFDDPYEIIPLTSRGNVSNKTQNDFINKYLRIIVASYFDCSISEIELIDANPEKIIFSPVGRVYNISNYEQLSINELSLKKIFPIDKIKDDGTINQKTMRCSSQYGFINACKTNYPLIARDLIIDNPDSFNAFFIDFSGINNYGHDYSKLLNDSDTKLLKIPLYTFYNISQIAFKKIEYSNYYAINQELAQIISFSYYYNNNEFTYNPYEIISKFEINNVYFESRLLEIIEEKINKSEFEKATMPLIYDSLYYLSSLFKQIPTDDIVNKLKRLFPEIPPEEIKFLVIDHNKNYQMIFSTLLGNCTCESCFIYSTQMSVDYINNMNTKINTVRIHNLQKNPYSNTAIVIPFYSKSIYNAILYPRAHHIYYILDNTKKTIHDSRITDFKKFLTCDAESMLSKKNHKSLKSVIFEDSLEEEVFTVITNELELKIKETQYQHEKKIKVCIALFDDNSRRFLALNNTVYLLDYEDDDNIDHQEISKKKVSELQPGDPIIWYSSQADDFEDSLTGIFLQNNKMKQYFDETQEWRIILQEMYKKKNNDINKLQLYLNEHDIKVTKPTLNNWIEKKYHIYPQNKELYIPIIFKFRNEKHNKAQQCINNISKYMKLRHSLGRKIKSFLIHDFSEGEKNIEDWILRFVDENNEPLFTKDDKAIINGLNQILKHIELLRVEKINKDINLVPQSWIGKRIDQV